MKSFLLLDLASLMTSCWKFMPKDHYLLSASNSQMKTVRPRLPRLWRHSAGIVCSVVGAVSFFVVWPLPGAVVIV